LGRFLGRVLGRACGVWGVCAAAGLAGVARLAGWAESALAAQLATDHRDASTNRNDHEVPVIAKDLYTYSTIILRQDKILRHHGDQLPTRGVAVTDVARATQPAPHELRETANLGT
jgi:hypothetical protein